jgi:hypothetical protein
MALTLVFIMVPHALTLCSWSRGSSVIPARRLPPLGKRDDLEVQWTRCLEWSGSCQAGTASGSWGKGTMFLGT